MVHALKQILSLLAPQGRLVDIHPTADPPPIEVRLGTLRHPVGWLSDERGWLSYERADAALDTVLQEGLYVGEEAGTFEYLTCADSVTALEQYLEETWQSALIEPQIARRAADLLQSVEEDKEICLRETVQIARLRPKVRQEGGPA